MLWRRLEEEEEWLGLALSSLFLLEELLRSFVRERWEPLDELEEPEISNWASRLATVRGDSLSEAELSVEVSRLGAGL